MWPFRPEKLTDVFPPEEIRQLLHLGVDVGSALTIVERVSEDGYVSLSQPGHHDVSLTGGSSFGRDGSSGRDGGPYGKENGKHADPFCTYFRQGRYAGQTAFEGADEACARCEQRMGRRLLSPSGGTALPVGGSGVAKLRCHMGLTEFLVPVRIGGKTVACLIGGRRVESEDDRQRIRKSVGKIGKLTRAEAESAGSGDHILITPADERARDRLAQEIAAIPLASEDFESRLAALGELFSRMATRMYEAERWARDEAFIEAGESRPAETPRTAGELRRETEVVLESIRKQLEVEYIVLFGLLPRELDQRDVNPSLIAAAGLVLNTAKRLLELDWGRIPPTSADPTHGLECVRSAINILVPTRDTPSGLKDKLTKSLFLAPVGGGTQARSVLLFGPAVSSVPPESSDYRLLVRLARSVSRWYYAQAAHVDRHWLAQRLLAEDDARRQAEEGRRAAEAVLRQAEEARRQEDRTRGFSHFNFRKLVDQCLEGVQALATGRGVDFDARALPDRLMYDGERHRLARAVQEILARCLERTKPDAEGGKAAPVRVFLKRNREGIVFGAEAVGDYLDGEERRRLFARNGDGAEPSARGTTFRAASRSASADEAYSPETTSAEDISLSRESALAATMATANVPAEPGFPAVGGNAEPFAGPGEGHGAGPAPSEEASRDLQPQASAPLNDRASGCTGGAAGTPAALRIAVPPTLREVLATVRRHSGRLRVESERLRRLQSDPRRWLGRTAFLLELPFLVKSTEEDGPSALLQGEEAKGGSGGNTRADTRRGPHTERGPGKKSDAQKHGPPAAS